VNYLGFREKDLEALSEFCRTQLGQEINVQELSTTGRNWGRVALNGSSLMFLVDNKVMFEVPLPDVSQAQQAKDEVVLEFHVDDTGDREDTLVEMALHVPPNNQDWKEEGEEVTPGGNAAKSLLDTLMVHTDADAARSEDAVVIFEDVAVMAPRGRFEVEMHNSHFKMVGQTNDFKIRYTSIVRIWVLPKSATPHTLVVVSLDPPIRKGQTYYSHLLCQFSSTDEISLDLEISDEQLAAKNEKCGGKLAKTMSGPIYDVFARTLSGLSGSKISRANTSVYSNAAGDGVGIRCSYKADDGYLYPMKHSFIYVHKPPLLIQHQDIDSAEFQRQGGGVISSSVRTFDLAIKVKNNNQELLFRNINRAEWQTLFDYLQNKRIKIENFQAAKQGPIGPGTGITIDEGEMDAGMRAAAAEADSEEDEDFKAGSGDEDSSSGGSLDEEGIGSESGSDDAELVDEEGINAEAISGKPSKKRKSDADGAGGSEPKPKKPKVPRAPKEPKVKKDAAAAGEDGAPVKKQRKKKDPNAPKNALSAFMYFSNDNRDKVKADNPGIPFGQVGKLLGEQWKALTAEDKVKYDEMAKKDKERYQAQMAEYKKGLAQAAGGDGGGAAAVKAEDGGDWGSDGEQPAGSG